MSPIKPTRPKFACPYCDFVGSHHGDQKRHRETHRPFPVQTCDVCGRVFSSGHGSAYLNHRIAHDQAAEVFWAQVDKNGPNGCWEWQGVMNYHGYGRARVAGKRISAHRVAWELLRGPIDPPSLSLDHLCRNTKCVNPDHLEPVTHTENIRRGFASRASSDPFLPCPECDFSTQVKAALLGHIRFVHRGEHPYKRKPVVVHNGAES